MERSPEGWTAVDRLVRAVNKRWFKNDEAWQAVAALSGGPGPDWWDQLDLLLGECEQLYMAKQVSAFGTPSFERMMADFQNARAALYAHVREAAAALPCPTCGVPGCRIAHELDEEYARMMAEAREMGIDAPTPSVPYRIRAALPGGTEPAALAAMRAYLEVLAGMTVTESNVTRAAVFAILEGLRDGARDLLVAYPTARPVGEAKPTEPTEPNREGKP